MSFTLVVTRAMLVGMNACQEGVDFFDTVMTRSEEDPLADTFSADWTEAYGLMMSANYPAFMAWLRARDLVPNTNLNSQDLTGIPLAGACLASADMSETDLSGVDMSNANLQQASFAGADLTGTDFTGANLTGASFDGATRPEGGIPGYEVHDDGILQRCGWTPPEEDPPPEEP